MCLASGCFCALCANIIPVYANISDVPGPIGCIIGVLCLLPMYLLCMFLLCRAMSLCVLYTVKYVCDVSDARMHV
jgi:hypothetical protein